MPHTIVNPDTLHDPRPFGYSHSAALPAGAGLVLISGQYASGPDGAVTATDFAEQVEQTFAHLAEVLAAHRLSLADVVGLRTYVVGLDGERLGVLGQAVVRRWGDTPPTQTVLGVAGLALPEILVEVEAVAGTP